MARILTADVPTSARSALERDPRCELGAIVRWRDRLYWAIEFEMQSKTNYGMSGAVCVDWACLHVQDFSEGDVEWIDWRELGEAELVKAAPAVPDGPPIDTLF